MSVTLYVGCDVHRVQRRRVALTGPRCFTAAYGPHSRFTPQEAAGVRALLDSGAFSDPPERRLTPEGSLERQLRWEGAAARNWGLDWSAEALVSYDRLIDEKWSGGVRRKERWGVREADRAVRETVEAARWLASQRDRLRPRTLALSCQGVDAAQYRECVQGVLAHAQPQDWIGLGGWCILGQRRHWMPTFHQAMRRCLPLIADHGVRRVHVFGVLYRPALGALLWLCDSLGLACSTDSTSPVLAATLKGSGNALAPTWEENVAAHQRRLEQLRAGPHYREPPGGPGARQQELF